MRTKLISIVIFIAFHSCITEYCPDNNRLESDFRERIKRIESLGANQVVGGRFFLDVQSLYSLTQIPSSISYGDVSVYATEEDIQTDVSKWEDWFKSNGCGLRYDTLMKIDEKILVHEDWLRVD